MRPQLPEAQAIHDGLNKPVSPYPGCYVIDPSRATNVDMQHFVDLPVTPKAFRPTINRFPKEKTFDGISTIGDLAAYLPTARLDGDENDFMGDRDAAVRTARGVRASVASVANVLGVRADSLSVKKRL